MGSQIEKSVKSRLAREARGTLNRERIREKANLRAASSCVCVGATGVIKTIKQSRSGAVIRAAVDGAAIPRGWDDARAIRGNQRNTVMSRILAPSIYPPPFSLLPHHPSSLRCPLPRM